MLASPPPHAQAHGNRNAIINSCQVSASRVTEGESVTFSARVTNRDSGVRSAVLYVVFHVYHSGSEVYKITMDDRTVRRGSSYTFTSSRITAGSSRLPVGRNAVVCGLWSENAVGNDTLQEHTGGGGTGHPIPDASITVEEEQRNRAPRIVDEEPNSPVELTAGDSPTFTAEATDADGNLTSVAWTVDNRRTNCNESFRQKSRHESSCRAAFGEGRHTVRVTFSDAGGLTDSHSWRVIVEARNRAPRIVDESPSSQRVTLTAGESRRFTAEATDADDNLTSVEWTLDSRRRSDCGESLRQKGRHESSCEIRFPEAGSYRVEATFEDDDGETDSHSWSVTVEQPNRPPEIVNETPSASISLDAGDSQTFTATATDADGNLSSVEWTLNDRRYSCGQSLRQTGRYESSCPIPFDEAGRYTVEVTFTDSSGLTVSQSWSVTVEQPNRPPEIVHESPSASISLDAGDSQTFTAEATDADGNLSSVEWTLDDRRYSCGQSLRQTGRYESSCPVTFDDAGGYTVEVTFTDSSGLTDSQSWSVNVTQPNRPPEIVSVNPRQSLALKAGDSRTFTAEATDADGNLSSVEWTLNGDYYACGQSLRQTSRYESSCPVTFDDAGGYTVEVTFTDAGGLTVSQRWSVGVEQPNRPPEIVNESPSASLRLGGPASQRFTATATDADGNLSSVEWTLDNRRTDCGESLRQTSRHDSSCTLTFPEGGEYIVKVTFADADGLTVSQSWSVNVPNSPPEIVNESPSASLNLHAPASQRFTATATDADGDLSSVEWTLDNQRTDCGQSLRQTGKHESSCPITFPEGGIYVVKVTFTDAGGLTDSQSWSVNVGTPPTHTPTPTPPRIVNQTPNQNQTLALDLGASQTFAATAQGALESVRWTLNGIEQFQCGQTLNSSGGKSECPLTFQTADSYRVEVEFIGIAGATAQNGWDVAVSDRKISDPVTPTSDPPTPTPTFTPVPPPPTFTPIPPTVAPPPPTPEQKQPTATPIPPPTTIITPEPTPTPIPPTSTPAEEQPASAPALETPPPHTITPTPPPETPPTSTPASEEPTHSLTPDVEVPKPPIRTPPPPDCNLPASGITGGTAAANMLFLMGPLALAAALRVRKKPRREND